ncbi:MAG: MFS transporter [Chloroflexi bacterium]|nr:MFS transporter [Chloroflexota bacterium]
MARETLEQVPVLPQARRGGLVGTFWALRYRNYRYLWMGQLGHACSLWMEQVVRPLLILLLTESALQVGLVIAARTVPIFVLGLAAGVIADRYDKKRVLLYSQAVTLVTHLVLGLLIVSGQVAVWHVFLTAFVAGGATAFTQPVKQTLIPRFVPREDLVNALALNSAAMNMMRVAGAGLAGLLLIFFDYGQVYLLNALVYVGVMGATVKMNVPQESRKETSTQGRVSFMEDFVEGLRYVNKNRTVLYLVGMALLLFVLGQPYQQVFIPLLALDVLEIGRSGVGWMLALTGVGALAGSLTVAWKGAFSRRGPVMIGALVVFSLSLVLLAQSQWLLLSTLALLLAGGMTTTYMALNNSLLLEQTPRELHGRVMSLLSLDRGMISLGAILGGGLAELLGPQWGLTLMAVGCLGLVVLAFFFLPVVRRMQ